jgi:hypothetical protein
MAEREDRSKVFDEVRYRTVAKCLTRLRKTWKRLRLEDLGVARDRIELPTRGFSVL